MRKGWEYKRLGEVCTIERGGSPRPINDYITDSEDGINWIKIGDAQEGSKYITSTKEKIKPEGVKKSRFVHKGDFILSNSMSFGRPYILKVDGCIHDGWLVIHDNNDILIKDYLYYLLASPTMYAKFSQLAVGGVVNNLNSSLVRKVEITIPPKSTQLVIVSELDKINELIRLKKEQLKDFDNLAQSLFYEMFGDPVENEKGWEVKKLGEIGEFKNGLNFSKDENGHSIKFLGVSDFQNKKRIASDQLAYISLSERVQEDYLLKTGDIVFVRSNGKKELIGRSVKMYISEPTTYSGFCIRCRITDEKVDKDYIAILLKTPIIRQLMTNSGRGCNISNLNQKVLNSIPIILPPLSLQHLFAQRIEQIEREKSEVQKSIQDLETLLASRMQYWFE